MYAGKNVKYLINNFSYWSDIETILFGITGEGKTRSLGLADVNYYIEDA